MFKMAKTRKKTFPQAELTFFPAAIEKPERPQKEKILCPVFYPPTGEGLKALVLRLAPILKRTGWEVRVVQEENGEEALVLQRGNGQTRRLSPDELTAWQALLPQLAGVETLF